jgi:hypothetical protein
MPLGSARALGLAGPNGTPLIGVLPAPADPAGGVSCAKACEGTIRLPSAKARTSAELRGIQVSPDRSLRDVALTMMSWSRSRAETPSFSRKWAQKGVAPGSLVANSLLIAAVFMCRS